jgi:hypothetical protein
MASNCTINNYVPLDYIKAKIVNFDIELILNKKYLVFSELVDTDSGEIIKAYYKNGEVKRPRRTAFYQNLMFQYYPRHKSKKGWVSQQLILSGSLHYFSNNGKHNYNDFDVVAFDGALIRLFDLFNLEPHNLQITQIEWGLNLILPFDLKVNAIIAHCILFKWHSFEVIKDNQCGKYYQALFKKYYALKIYNKGLHFNLPYDILRVERKQLNYLKFCKQQGIGQLLSDLIESDFKGFRETLISNWQDVLFFDPSIDKTNEKIVKYRDPLYWKGFNNRTTRKNHFDKLTKANIEIGGNYQNKIAALMTEKINDLNQPNFTFSYFSYNKKPLTPIIEMHYGIQSNAC